MGKAILNCWEKKKCGLEPGGWRVREYGICPVAISTKANSIHGGVNGGRACWAIEGTITFCQVQCKLDENIESCKECDFYSEVKSQEGYNFMKSAEILTRLKALS